MPFPYKIVLIDTIEMAGLLAQQSKISIAKRSCKMDLWETYP